VSQILRGTRLRAPTDKLNISLFPVPLSCHAYANRPHTIKQPL
jgi:hypothetical protein